MRVNLKLVIVIIAVIFVILLVSSLVVFYFIKPRIVIEDNSTDNLENYCDSSYECTAGETCYLHNCVKEECNAFLPCKEEKVCVSGLCKTQQDLEKDGISCKNSGELCSLKCDNCKKRYLGCSGRGDIQQDGSEIHILMCIECTFDDDCNEGYICDEIDSDTSTYNCVKKIA